MMRLSLLGSTGSIGTQALEVVRNLRAQGEEVQVVALAARSSVQALEAQAREFRPAVVAVFEEAAARSLRESLADTGIPVLAGMEGLCQAAAWETATTTLNAVVGMVGLQPTLAAIRAGKTVALANKETLVAGGAMVMEEARSRGVAMLPVDSEHSAIFQCLQGCPEKGALEKLILTASGGPFFGRKRQELAAVTREQAAVMLYNYARSLELSAPEDGPAAAELADAADVVAWARPAVEFCLRTGTLTADGSGRFLPGDTITREEAAEALEAFALYVEANQAR